MIGKVGHKAVLVYPRFDTQETFWSYERSLRLYSPTGEFGLPKRLLPPLGLMGLYGYLKPHYDEILLTDRNVDPRPLETLLRDCDHVYIGGMLTQENELLKDAGIVKKAGKTLIAGGPVVAPDSPLMRIADHMVENEAEMVMEDLLTGLAGGNAAKYYRGAYAPPERFFKPDYASINFGNYMHMAVQISRGCPESCEFCDAPDRFGKGYRIAPFEDTRASFQQMADLGWRGPVFIVDDNFIGNPKIALEVLKNLYRNGEAIGFHHPKYTELTLRLADDLPVMRELRDWLKRTRFINCFYGVETPNKASLEETGKRQNLRGEKTLAEKLAYLSEQTGAGAMMGMIYGFDHDTRETVGEIIEFVNATNAPVVMAGLLNALPGTPLMARMKRQGRFIASSSRNNSDGVINFIPQNFSVQQAESDYLDILEGIYSPDAYFTRVMRHLALIEPVLPNSSRSGGDKIQMLLRILTRKNALIYWRHLPWAHAIARKRFGLNAPGYWYVIGEYFALCGQFTHFRGQVDVLKKEFSKKNYRPWQRYSWNELQHSEVRRVEKIDCGVDGPLSDKIRVGLAIEHEMVGTRLETLGYFVEPFVLEGLARLKSDLPPTREQFIELEIEAYRRVCDLRPEIVEGIDFSEVEAVLRKMLCGRQNFLADMRRLLRKTIAITEQA